MQENIDTNDQMILHEDTKLKENIDTDDPAMILERTKLVVEMWKTTIEAQHHFNNMEMVIRNFAVTVLAAIIAAAGVSVQNDAPLLALWILMAGSAAILVILVTEFGYHRLLQGAVKHSTAIETVFAELYGKESMLARSITLSSTITTQSHIKLTKRNSVEKGIVIRSTDRVLIFYGLMLLLLVASMVIVQFFWSA